MESTGGYFPAHLVMFFGIMIAIFLTSSSWAKQGVKKENRRKINIMRDHASRITSLVFRYKLHFNNASELLDGLSARHLWQKFRDPYTDYRRVEDIAIIDVDNNGQVGSNSGTNAQLLRSSLGLYRGNNTFSFFIYDQRGQIAHQTDPIEYPVVSR